MNPQASVFLEAVVAFLLPYFGPFAASLEEARAEIIETLAAYATRTRAEMLQAAQIIALGMTTLDVLADARANEMSLSMRLRYRSCANGLRRSTQQAEKSLEKRLAADPSPAAEAQPEPLNDLPDADIDAAVDHAMSIIAAHRRRLPEKPATSPTVVAGPPPAVIPERIPWRSRGRFLWRFPRRVPCRSPEPVARPSPGRFSWRSRDSPSPRRPPVPRRSPGRVSRR